MKDQAVLNQQDLDALLALFSTDREAAGKAYEDLRRGLVRYFRSKGCPDSFELADETLSRVATKAGTYDDSKNSKPSTFVYGFASRVYLEYTRRPQKLAVEFDAALHSPIVHEPETSANDHALDCLDQCLAKNPAEERSLIIRYYSKEKHEKIELRKRLAKELGCTVEVLHMRVHRMRAALKTCVSRCLEKQR